MPTRARVPAELASALPRPRTRITGHDSGAAARTQPIHRRPHPHAHSNPEKFTKFQRTVLPFTEVRLRKGHSVFLAEEIFPDSSVRSTNFRELAPRGVTNS